MEQHFEDRFSSIERLLQQVLGQTNSTGPARGAVGPVESGQEPVNSPPSGETSAEDASLYREDRPGDKRQSPHDALVPRHDEFENQMLQVLDSPHSGDEEEEDDSAEERNRNQIESTDAHMDHDSYADGFGELLPDANGYLR